MGQIKEKAKPFTYEAGDTLAILIHGFTGTPDDMRNLASFLAQHGISVSAIRLAGHGRKWQDLAETTCYDWWKSVDDEVKKSIGKYRKIYLIGYSFGANLAFDISARYPNDITGVVSLGVSAFLRNSWMGTIVLPFYHYIINVRRYRKGYIKNSQMLEFEETGAYVYIPTSSLYEFKKFINIYTKKELPKVTVPSLVIHSKDDHITHPFSSEFVYRKISSNKKELVLLDDVNHNPLSSKRRDIIFSKIIKFINTI